MVVLKLFVHPAKRLYQQRRKKIRLDLWESILRRNEKSAEDDEVKINSLILRSFNVITVIFHFILGIRIQTR